MTRIVELDALRGLAALAVAVFHLRRYQHDALALSTAVDLFFVISGYLITAILLRHRGEPGLLRSFYIRRSLRIWPIYFLTLAVVLAVPRSWVFEIPRGSWPWYATFTQVVPQYWGERFQHLPLFAHTWTLAIEEQFYLIWPWLVVATGRRGVLWATGPALILSASLRADRFNEMLLLARWDGLILGSFLAAALPKAVDGQAARRWRAGLIVLALAALPLAWTLCEQRIDRRIGSWPRSLERSAWAFGYAAIVGLAVLGRGGRAWRWLRWPPLVALGTISYGFYLYQFPVYAWFSPGQMRKTGPMPSMAEDALALIALGAVATLSWWLIERPILAGKVRWAPYRSG